MRRTYLFYIFLLFFLSSGMGADELSRDVVEARIVTNPADAEIFLETSGRRKYEEYLGKADSKLLIDLTRFEGASGYNLVIRRDGYFDKSERVPMGYFDTRDRYPELGAVRLEPHNQFVPILVFLQKHLVLVVVGIAIVAGGFWFRKRRKKHQKKKQKPKLSQRKKLSQKQKKKQKKILRKRHKP